MLKVLLGIVAGFVLVPIVVVVIFAVALGSTVHSSQAKAANVTAHIDEVQMGMSKSQVESILGKPEDSQHMEMALFGQTDTNDCIYYGEFSSTIYQFCFTNGALDAKDQY
jgi:hypothetical protein